MCNCAPLAMFQQVYASNVFGCASRNASRNPPPSSSSMRANHSRDGFRGSTPTPTPFSCARSRLHDGAMFQSPHTTTARPRLRRLAHRSSSARKKSALNAARSAVLSSFAGSPNTAGTYTVHNTKASRSTHSARPSSSNSSPRLLFVAIGGVSPGHIVDVSFFRIRVPHTPSSIPSGHTSSDLQYTATPAYPDLPFARQIECAPSHPSTRATFATSPPPSFVSWKHTTPTSSPNARRSASRDPYLGALTTPRSSPPIDRVVPPRDAVKTRNPRRPQFQLTQVRRSMSRVDVDTDDEGPRGKSNGSWDGIRDVIAGERATRT